jgi:hypothetical protein
VASGTTGAKFQVVNAAGTVLTTVTVPNTGGWQTWKSINASVNLTAGSQALKLVSTTTTRWNFNYFTYTAPTSTTTPSGTKTEAENYTTMYGVQKEITTDIDGGQNVGYIDINDWMKYSVNAATSGTYTFTFRVASGATGAQFKIKNSSGTDLATVNVPNTGGWQTWKDVRASINLTAGTQTLIFSSTATPRWNINYFTHAASLTETPVEVPIGTTSGTFRTGFRLEAENYTSMFGVLKQTANDFGGGVQNLFDFNLNDWASYSINVATAGLHTLNFRIACR